MRNFNMGALLDWSQVELGKMIAFDLPATGYRMIEFDLVADSPISVQAATPEDAWLVAAGLGMISVKFSTSANVGVMISGDPDALVYMRTRIGTQVVAESGEPTFTTIEPKRTQSDDVTRMVRIMNLNREFREAQLRAEYDARLAALENAAAPPLVEPPAPAPAPKVAEGEA